MRIVLGAITASLALASWDVQSAEVGRPSINQQEYPAGIGGKYFPLKTDLEWCESSQVNAKQFVEIFHRIAMHGDLTDLPFLKETLHIPLGPYHPLDKNGQPNRHLTTFLTGPNPIFNAPITMDLYLSDKERTAITGRTASLSFFGTFFNHCVHIPSADFEKQFGGGFTTAPNSSTLKYKTLPGIGKPGFQIRVSYVRNQSGPNPFVEGPFIEQYISDSGGPSHEKK